MNLLKLFFGLNILLLLIDAATSYFAAPSLAEKFDVDDVEEKDYHIRRIRRNVNLMVAINSAAVCAGFFWGSVVWSIIISLVLAGDVGVAIYFMSRKRVNP